ncbi:hypothetical protein AAVH_33616, partial [Aphelenchoides avenae]
MLNSAIGKLYAVPATNGDSQLVCPGEESAVSEHGETADRIMDRILNNLHIPVYDIKIYELCKLSDSYFRLIERVKHITTLKHL